MSDQEWGIPALCNTSQSRTTESARPLAIEAPAWQPIKTAPKDGTPVLLFWRDNYGRELEWIGVGQWYRYREGGERRGGWTGSSIWCSEPGSWSSVLGEKVTHWMPFPAPPTA